MIFNNIFSIKCELEHILIYVFGIKIKFKTKYTKIYRKRFDKNFSLEEQKYVIEKQFKERVGYTPNLDNPKTFNEKLQWLKLNNENPLITKCADKYLVREYIKEKIGEEYLIPLLGVYNTPDEIDFDKLPNQFVMKVNWGSGQNIIVKDKSILDIKDANKKLTEWIKKNSNHYYFSFEWSYKNIKPKIIIEKYIEEMSGSLLDYKFFCFNGIPTYVQIDVDRFTNHKRCFYDMNFIKQNFTTYYPLYTGNIDKPENFEAMIEFSKILSKNFPFARIDFYNLNGNIKFGEITFYHGNGMEPFTPAEWDYKLGDMLKLPFEINP